MPVRAPWITTAAYRPTAKHAPMLRAFYESTKSKPKLPSLPRLRAIKEPLVNLRRQNKIAFRQPVDLVCVRLHVHAAPRQRDVGMMPFLLGDRAYPVHEIECGFEIRKNISL